MFYWGIKIHYKWYLIFQLGGGVRDINDYFYWLFSFCSNKLQQISENLYIPPQETFLVVNVSVKSEKKKILQLLISVSTILTLQISDLYSYTTPRYLSDCAYSPVYLVNVRFTLKHPPSTHRQQWNRPPLPPAVQTIS